MTSRPTPLTSSCAMQFLCPRYLPAESHSSTSKGTVPDFDDWDETDGWHTVEGQFVGIGVLPQIIVAGCAPPALGTAAARAAAVSARKRKEANFDSIQRFSSITRNQ